MYKVNWSVYRALVASIPPNSEERGERDLIAEMMSNYLYGNSMDLIPPPPYIRELIALGILVPIAEEKKNVPPFNFVGDGTQSS